MQIQIKRDDIINKLIDNKADHVAEYTTAVEEFKKLYRDKLDQMIRAADQNEFHNYLDLVIPESYEKEYDRAIELFKMDVRDIIEMNEDDYNKYILNEWHWSWSFANSTQAYNKPQAFNKLPVGMARG